MINADAREQFEIKIRQELGTWPEGSKLEVVMDETKQPDVERDHYICTLIDSQDTVLGRWPGVETQKMYAPVPSFSVSRL